MQKRLIFLLWTLLASVHILRAQLPQSGYASYYGDKFHGRKTASGERYHKDSLTAAHRSLPFGTLVKVTYLKKGSSVVVRITDRGPYSRGRKIDLSKAAARQIGMIGIGVVYVSIEPYYGPVPPVFLPDGKTADEGTGGDYVVQTGVFREYENAIGLKDSLQVAGFAFGIDTIQVKTETMYRVSTEPFTRKDEAEELVRKLRELDIDSYVIRL